MQVKNFRMPSLQEEEILYNRNTAVSTAPVPEPDNKAVAWQKRNSWFGQDRSMTAFALGLHEDLRTMALRLVLKSITANWTKQFANGSQRNLKGRRQ
jgi:hypothetical protein